MTEVNEQQGRLNQENEIEFQQAAAAALEGATPDSFLPDHMKPGYWTYRGEDSSFLLDEQCAAYFNLEYGNKWIPESDILHCITLQNQERYRKVMESIEMGSIIFEDVVLNNSRFAGKNFVINGSVLSRFPDGRVRYAVGYITYVQSSFSEFIAHEIAGDGFYTWESSTGILHFSVSYRTLLGYENRDFNCNFYEWISMLVHPDDADIVETEKHILTSPVYGDNFEFCVRLRHNNGDYIWAIGRGIVLKRDAQGFATSVIGTLSDINLVQDNFDNIKQLLYTDTLTNLKNRSYFQHHSARWSEPEKQPVSVIYADVTGLKITNDVLGHADGDRLLISMTDLLQTVITRPCDLMRLAGDEFLALMPHCSQEESKQILEQLKEGMRLHNSKTEIAPLFAGFGRATMGEIKQDTLHACIERADVRMQADKDANRTESYRELKAYLEKRKGRPVSMRDGRRLQYLSKEERKTLHQTQASKTPY